MSHRSLRGFESRVMSRVVLGQAAGSILATYTKRQKAPCIGLVVVCPLALRTGAVSLLAASSAPAAPAFLLRGNESGPSAKGRLAKGRSLAMPWLLCRGSCASLSTPLTCYTATLCGMGALAEPQDSRSPPYTALVA
jgi:hypothetical protein